MDLVQLDALCSDLTVAAKTLKALCDDSGNNSPASGNESSKDSLHPLAKSQDEISHARSNLCGIASRLQILLAGPTCFIRQMATQVRRHFQGSWKESGLVLRSYLANFYGQLRINYLRV